MKFSYLSLGLAALGAWPAFSQTGTITGTVRLSEGNLALGGVEVTATRQGPPARVFTARSAADGSFTLANLPVGRYTVCAPNPAGDRLDACAWANRAPLVVNLAGGQVSAGNVAQVLAGRRLRIRVNDTQRYLEKESRDWRAPSVEFNVVEAASGVQRAPALKQRSAAGLEYELLVPVGRSYRLEAASRDVTLQNGTGAMVARQGSNESFAVTAASAPELVYTVTSRR